jgi:hypothetical protein
MKGELRDKFRSDQRLQHVFEKWVERCKKSIAAKGGTSEERPSPNLHEVPTRSNNVSPRTLQTVLLFAATIHILEAVSSIRNPKTGHAVMSGRHNMAYQ